VLEMSAIRGFLALLVMLSAGIVWAGADDAGRDASAGTASSRKTSEPGSADKLGIEQQVIKTGEFKDQGSLYRRLTTEEREQLQALLEEALNDFVAAVAEGRGMSQAAVREYADGSIWSGSMAVEDGLADEEGDLHDAVDMAARLAGVRGKPQVVRYAPMAPTFVDLLRGAARGDGPGAEELLMEHFVEQAMLPSLQYLYLGP